ncbi:MAG: type IV pilin protein [bacterium]|nr:type IV pilin protein [bacterium]
MKHTHGFTLMELMIVVGIIAIGAAFAIPAYQGYIQRAERSAAQADLVAATAAMERYKAQRFTYANAAAGTTFPAISPTNAAPGDQKYDLTLTVPADGTSYEITATSTALFGSTTETMLINNQNQRCLNKSGTTCTYGAAGSNW